VFDPTLEDVLLDPIAAEALRASVDGEWVELSPLERLSLEFAAIVVVAGRSTDA
jgi:hypothetical protein